jgi:hypothetical protein
MDLTDAIATPETGSPSVGGGSGNTVAPTHVNGEPANRRQQGRRWAITLYNGEDIGFLTHFVEEKLRERNGLNAVWQIERGEKTERLHAQLLIELPERKDGIAWLQKWFGRGHHFEASKGRSRDQAIRYHTKSQTRVAGPWWSGDTEWIKDCETLKDMWSGPTEASKAYVAAKPAKTALAWAELKLEREEAEIKLRESRKVLIPLNLVADALTGIDKIEPEAVGSRQWREWDAVRQRLNAELAIKAVCGGYGKPAKKSRLLVKAELPVPVE